MVRANVLLLVQNESAPVRDPRVRREVQTLTRAGFGVTVVCPQGADCDVAEFECVDGVVFHRYPRPPGRPGMRAHLLEYAQAGWHIARTVLRLVRRQRFDVVHACNPPDFLLLIAAPLKLQGTRFIFDHHDLSPELYQNLYGDRWGLLRRLLRVLERTTFAFADVVLSTNDSYRRIALERGGKRAEDVFVVRNAPDTNRFRPRPADPALRRGVGHLIGYVGVIGPQDGVDCCLRALASLRRRRQDWRAIFVGTGRALDDVRQLAHGLGLGDVVEFTGYVGDDEVVNVLASSDVCLSPEPATTFNNMSTWIKIGEYMAMAKPIVCFDLAESRFAAGDAACYARPGDDDDFAACISQLLDDPDRRATMGAVGRARVEGELSWEHAERALLGAYDRVLDRRHQSVGVGDLLTTTMRSCRPSQ